MDGDGVGRTEKADGAFRTIREVSDWLGVPTHVLRFWESKFDQVEPVKGSGGRRYYRPDDMRLLGGIKVLLHDRGQTIRGVARKIKDEGTGEVIALSPPLDGSAAPARPVRRVLRPAEESRAPTPAPASSPETVEAETAPAVPDADAGAEGEAPPSWAALALVRSGRLRLDDPRRVRRIMRRLRGLADEIEDDLRPG